MKPGHAFEPLNRFVSEHNQNLVLSRLFGARVEPSRLGRYSLHEVVGKGGMGIVFAGHDPQLDRKVAIKLLRAAGSTEARRRFVREAQAMAKLSHANVVSVFEVGEAEHAGEPVTFIAMEFIDGLTLSRWLGERPRDRAEILAVLRRAGRGLAAVHAAGLVHRDFKPDNVMIQADGRVVVTDFGLADELETDAQADAGASGRLLAGTPAYMAPEQLDGRGADALSDQFSFCVTLYEALYGERPFEASTPARLRAAITEQRLGPTPRGATVPAWLRKVIVRGLAADPGARWPSIPALLDALADDPALRRRRWLAALGGLALLAGAWGLGVRTSGEPQAQPCAGMAAKLDGVWDDDRRAEVRAALLGTELAYAPATWTRVAERLDDYSGAWVEGRTAACEASEDGEQSGELLDRRMACLDRRLAHLRASVDILARADPAIVNRAVQMVWELPVLERCADSEALLADLAPPSDPALVAQVADLDDRLAEAEALRDAGEYAAGLTLVDEAVAEAETLDYEPIRARAWLRQGSLRDRNGDFAGARDSFERAYDSALGLGMGHASALAAANLIWIVGGRLADHAGGRTWAVHADPLSRAADEQARIVYLNSLGNLASAEGHYDEAAELLEQAVALVETELGPDHPYLAYALNNLSNVAGYAGRSDEAQAHLERSLALKQRILGPDHPHVASSLSNLAILAAEQGRLGQARELFEGALDQQERVYGPDNPALATHLGNLANLAMLEGDLDEARALLERTVAIVEAALGPEHPDLADALESLGEVALAQGDPDRAEAHLRRALAIHEAALGPEHPQVAKSLIGLAELERGRAQLATARTLLERAVAIREASVAPDSPKLASALAKLGAVLLDEDRADEALAKLERAATILASSEVAPRDAAATDFALARALWRASPRAGRDRPRALELAASARETYAHDDADEHTSELAELDTWLEQRGHRGVASDHLQPNQ